MALVFLGASLHATESSEEAIKAFHKAVRLQKENVLAYSGLAKVYEGKSDWKGLLSTYSLLLRLET